MGSRDLLGMMEMFFNWIGGMVAQLSRFTKKHCTVRFKWDHFMIRNCMSTKLLKAHTATVDQQQHHGDFLLRLRARPQPF